MSDICLPEAPFFTLYSAGRLTSDDIDEYVGAWHLSGDDEQRSLPAFLGMTDEEFAVLVMDDRTLPLILSARRDHVLLRAAVADYVAALRKEPCPADRAAIHAMTYWLGDRRPDQSRP